MLCRRWRRDDEALSCGVATRLLMPFTHSARPLSCLTLRVRGFPLHLYTWHTSALRPLASILIEPPPHHSLRLPDAFSCPGSHQQLLQGARQPVSSEKKKGKKKEHEKAGRKNKWDCYIRSGRLPHSSAAGRGSGSGAWMRGSYRARVVKVLASAAASSEIQLSCNRMRRPGAISPSASVP